MHCQLEVIVVVLELEHVEGIVVVGDHIIPPSLPLPLLHLPHPRPQLPLDVATRTLWALSS